MLASAHILVAIGGHRDISGILVKRIAIMVMSWVRSSRTRERLRYFHGLSRSRALAPLEKAERNDRQNNNNCSNTNANAGHGAL